MAALPTRALSQCELQVGCKRMRMANIGQHVASPGERLFGSAELSINSECLYIIYEPPRAPHMAHTRHAPLTTERAGSPDWALLAPHPLTVLRILGVVLTARLNAT